RHLFLYTFFGQFLSDLLISCYSNLLYPHLSHFFFLLLPRPPISTLFPYTTLFRSFAKTLIGSLPGGLAYVNVVAAMLYINISKRSEEHTSELQSRFDLVCRLLLEKKKKNNNNSQIRNN